MSELDYAQVDPKFPHRPSGLPPSPTVENPGGVFPHSDPDKATPAHTPPPGSAGTPQFVGNPFLMNDAFRKLDNSLVEVIRILELEEVDLNARERSKNALLEKFRDWREDLDAIRAGKRTRSLTPARISPRTAEEQEGGMFVD